MHFETYILFYALLSPSGRGAAKKIQCKGRKTLPLHCYSGNIHTLLQLCTRGLRWWQTESVFPGLSVLSRLLKPRFFQMSELSHGSIKEKSQKLDWDCSLKPLLNFKGSNEARIICSWVWEIAVETGVACHFEFCFHVPASQGKQGQSWWSSEEVQVCWLCWDCSLSHRCLLQPHKWVSLEAVHPGTRAGGVNLPFCSRCLVCRLSSSIPNLCNLKRGSSLTVAVVPENWGFVSNAEI